MKIFTSKEREEIIRYTVEHEGVAMSEIVSRVGKSVAAEVNLMCDARTHVVVFAGWGTNGAYALAAARYLVELGYSPEIYLFNIGGARLTDDCALAKKQLLKAFPDYHINEIVKDLSIPKLGKQSVVVDGLFGAELDRPLPMSFGMVIRAINESGARVVSIEIPSGLMSEFNARNNAKRDIMHATLTLAVELPCLSFFMTENIPLVGKWKIIEAGFSHEAKRTKPYTYYLITYNDVHRILRPRPQECSKADFGSALLCAGSYGMMGAAVLSTQGCLRAGAGKVTCHAPRCGYQIMQTAVPSAMFSADEDETKLTSLSVAQSYSAVGVGPGIGTDDATVHALESLLKMMQAKGRPVILDADAINCIAKRPMLLKYLPTYSILTPHAGEFDRVFGDHNSEEERIVKAREIATFNQIIIILKGRYTAIIRPDGKVHINSSGTPALATGGSGDVLTGVLTAFEAQNLSPEIAAFVGTFVHGVAGEIAEEVHGTYGVTASDVAGAVGQAIKSIMEE